MMGYLMEMKVEVLDAGLLAAPCPECSCRVARITYVITRRLRCTRRSEVVAVNDVLACEDEQLCGWTIPVSEAVA